MPSVTIQEFHADLHAVEVASESEPVFITEQGEPRRVLLDIADYRKLSQGEALEGNVAAEVPTDLADLLAVPESDHFDWEPPRLTSRLFEPADLA